MDYNFCTTGTLDRNRIGHEWKAIGHFTQVLDYHSHGFPFSTFLTKI